MKRRRIVNQIGVIFVTCLLVSLFYQEIIAATFYVRPNSYALGNNSGEDWTNAFRGMPTFNHAFWTSMLQPGDTVYVAGGMYTTAWKINKGGTSDEARITIKRATTSEHGSNVGWIEALDAQVVLSRVNIILYSDNNAGHTYQSPDYVTVDGVTWEGIRIDNTGGPTLSGVNVSINGNGVADYITLRNLHIVGWAGENGANNANCSADQAGDIGIFDMANGNPVDNNHYGLTLQYLHIEGKCNAGIGLAHSHNTLIENNLVHHIGYPGQEPVHDDGIISYDSDAGVFRNNVFYNMGSLFWLVEVPSCNNWEVYNNLFYQDTWTVGVSSIGIKFSGKETGLVTGWKIYSNTFYNLQYGVEVEQNADGDHEVDIKNNIFFSSPVRYKGINVTHDYNYYGAAIPAGDGGHSIGNGSDPFVNAALKNFRLASGVAPNYRGIDLSQYFTTDRDGNPRGYSTWSIGAYRGAPLPPRSLKISNVY